MQDELRFAASSASEFGCQDSATTTSGRTARRHPSPLHLGAASVDSWGTRKDLATGGYDYASTPWFTEPMRRKASTWSDAYFDEGGGEIMMVTYSAPVMKGGRAIGVLTADFALAEK